MQISRKVTQKKNQSNKLDIEIDWFCNTRKLFFLLMKFIIPCFTSCSHFFSFQSYSFFIGLEIPLENVFYYSFVLNYLFVFITKNLPLVTNSVLSFCFLFMPSASFHGIHTVFFWVYAILIWIHLLHSPL